MRTLKNRFIEAYCWMFGSSKKHAGIIYDNAYKLNQFDYIGAIIDAYENQTKTAFYCD